jgi:membrane protein DedA with SNARE-associated domain
MHRENRVNTWPFCATPKQHADARAFVERRGLASVLISKFQGFNRGLVPLETGVLERPALPFLATSAVSAVLWTLAVLAPALIVGTLIA